MGACLASGLAAILGAILSILQLIIFASIIVSFVGDPSNRFVQTINSISEPIYRPFRGLTSKIGGPIDWTPMIVILLIIFIEKTGVGFLAQIGRSCQNAGF